ncbi:hypothetical protein [Flavicella sediminum]|uniref:hypothetical protein n=1 Tax=Flavicella sediminum TaxID=2585141 RepID=UPI00112208B5|nr:hypothetical protein [Flavicella sediminum]
MRESIHAKSLKSTLKENNGILIVIVSRVMYLLLFVAFGLLVLLAFNRFYASIACVLFLVIAYCIIEISKIKRIIKTNKKISSKLSYLKKKL